MNISGIDEDFIDVINKLDKAGFKPYASCDGVISHHKDPKDVTEAYISFLKSERITDLMAILMENSEKYRISISNSVHNFPFELYGNIISGNRYSVYFDNLHGENSKQFESTISGVIDGKIAPPKKQKEIIDEVEEAILDSEEEELTFDFTFGASYGFHMQKEGKINLLSVSTKSGPKYMRDLSEVMQVVGNKAGVPVKNGDDDSEIYDEDEFITLYSSGTDARVYFTDEHLKEIVNLVKYLKLVEKDLKTKDINEPWYDEEER